MAAPLVDGAAAAVDATGVVARLVVEPAPDDATDPLVDDPLVDDPVVLDPPLVEGAVTAAGTVPS